MIYIVFDETLMSLTKFFSFVGIVLKADENFCQPTALWNVQLVKWCGMYHDAR